MTEQQRASPRRRIRRATTRSRNSLLHLFGSSRELLAKSNADLRRLVDALSSGTQREAVWALMDTAITVFHIGDWIRATHVNHRVASQQFAQDSKWIRMTRDLCHAAKHGDLTWEDSQAATFGPVLMKLEYSLEPDISGLPPNIIWAITSDGVSYDVLQILRNAISDWTRFLNAKGLWAAARLLAP